MTEDTEVGASVRAQSNSYIKKGVFIPRLSPKRSAEVLRPFSIQLLSTEDGYIATSDISTVYELEATAGEAIRSYLYSLVDEFTWLQEQKGNLSDAFLKELEQLQNYLRMV